MSQRKGLSRCDTSLPIVCKIFACSVQPGYQFSDVKVHEHCTGGSFCTTVLLFSNSPGDAQTVLTAVICSAAAINRRRRPSPSRRSAVPRSRQRSVTAKMHATPCRKREGRPCIRMVGLADGMSATLVNRLDRVK